MRRRYRMEDYEKKAYLVAVLATVVIVLTFSLWCLYPGLYDVELYLNVLAVVAAGATFWVSLRVLDRQRWILYDLLRAPWFYISTGLGLWLVAETMWLSYIVLFGEPLELSLADIAWLMGYVFIAIGLYRGVKPLSLLSREARLSHRMRLAYALPLALGVILAAATLAEVPQAIAEEGLLTVIVDTSYVLLDLLLLTLSLEGVVFFYGGRLAKGASLFSVGLALLAVSDLPYFAIGGYYPGNILDLFYVLSYVVMATGIYIYSKQPLMI